MTKTNPPAKAKNSLKLFGIVAAVLLLVVLALSLFATDFMSSAVTNAMKDIIAFFVIMFKL